MERRNKVFKRIFILVIVTAFVFNQSFTLAAGVTKTGTTAAKFLSIGLGPRANAMGGAFTSIANDASALYWNPAGIALVDKYEGLFTYTSMFADINTDFLGIVIPAGETGAFGFSVTAVNYGTMDVTTELYPEGTGETFSAGSYEFGLSYARFITDQFLVGVTAKYIQEDIYNSSATGFAFDVGTIFTTPFYGIKFSSAISNYGTKMQMTGQDLLIQYDSDPTRNGNNANVDANYATEQFELPLKLQIGISKEFVFLDDQKFTVAIDGIHPNDNSQYLNVGGELSLFKNMLSLRAGYKTLFLQDSQEGLTLGVGLHYEGLQFFNISVDYAYQKYTYLGNTHSFGLILDF